MAYTVCHAPLVIREMNNRSVSVATMELQTGGISTLAERWLDDVI